MKYGVIWFLCVLSLSLIAFVECKEYKYHNAYQMEAVFEVPRVHNTNSSYWHCQMRADRMQYRHVHSNNYYSRVTAIDFKNMFADVANEHEILSNYELYAYPEFCAYARTLSSYNDFINSLSAKIKTDKQLRRNVMSKYWSLLLVNVWCKRCKNRVQLQHLAYQMFVRYYKCSFSWYERAL